MSKTVSFTVVIPVFNGEAVIKNAINSVAAQTYKNFELIIVNDGSVDQTEDIVSSVCKTHNDLNWTLVSTPNRGRSHARNTGIQQAQGKFICFLDADDTFNTIHLQQFYKATLAHPQVSCFFADSEVNTLDANWTKYSNFLPRLLKRGDFWEKHNDYYIFSNEFSKFLIEGSLIPMCSTAIEKQTLLSVGMFNESFSSAEDYELWFRLALSHRFIAINKALSVVNHHEGNTSHPAQKFTNLNKQLAVTNHILLNNGQLDEVHSDLLINKRDHIFNDLMYHASLRGFDALWGVFKANKVLTLQKPLSSSKAILRSVLKRTI